MSLTTMELKKAEVAEMLHGIERSETFPKQAS